MEERVLCNGKRAALTGVTTTRKSRFILSLLIFSLYLGQPAAAASNNICPAPSPGFYSKLTYAGGTQAMIDAMGNTLRALAIHVVSAENLKAVTDNLDASTTPPDSKGQVTSTRYHFEIRWTPKSNGQTGVDIVTMIETASYPSGGTPSTWHNVSLMHLPTSMSCSHWLSEEFENTLSGHPPTETARTQIARLNGTAPLATVASVGVPSKAPASTGSDFDGGLGSSGDIGGGPNSGGAATPAKTKQKLSSSSAGSH